MQTLKAKIGKLAHELETATRMLAHLAGHGWPGLALAAAYTALTALTT
jgi:hypothetical protein